MSEEYIGLAPEMPENPTDMAMPFSNEAEQSVLGAMYLDRECIPDVIAKVTVEDFYISRHRELFEAIKSLYDIGKPIDLVTLKEQLILNGVLEKIGGIQ